jgi:hypothetical protein
MGGAQPTWFWRDSRKPSCACTCIRIARGKERPSQISLGILRSDLHEIDVWEGRFKMVLQGL